MIRNSSGTSDGLPGTKVHFVQLTRFGRVQRTTCWLNGRLVRGETAYEPSDMIASDDLVLDTPGWKLEAFPTHCDQERQETTAYC